MNVTNQLAAVLVSAAMFCGISGASAAAGSSAAGAGDSQTGGAAVSTVPSDKVTSGIMATLRERFPTVKIEKVGPSAWPGVYEVVSDNEIAYTNADASLLLSGKMIDTSTKQDLTAKRWSEVTGIEFGKLPFELAIKTVKGDGSRRMAVFSDPDCPYCRQLEQNLKDVTDVTIYTFLYPLQEIHPDAGQKAAKIWCAKDRAGAWSDWMLKKELPQARACTDAPVAQLLKLGEKLKVVGTPTMFFEDGHRMSGALSSADLRLHLGGQPGTKGDTVAAQ